MAQPNPELRRQVIAIYKGTYPPYRLYRTAMQENNFGHETRRRPRPGYKLESELLYLGREYPLGYRYFQPRLHKAFMSRAAERSEDKIRAGIAQAEYVKKGASIGPLFFFFASIRYHRS
ncbi:hypothetical protein X797_001221 [Metarhizium robertsii]|nr:hypothetical protein X797_001221 [Metarhizium robertsii]